MVGVNDEQHLDPEVIKILIDNHRRFLAFLVKRTGSRETAEEMLQAAFVKTLEKGSELRDHERAVAWFFRLLSNKVTDFYRQRAVEMAAFQKESDEAGERSFEVELKDQICECIKSLIPTLKPEYAEIISKVDLEEKSIEEVASEAGLTRNNATVRLHRARQALKKQLEMSCRTCAAHGCLDCNCKKTNHP